MNESMRCSGCGVKLQTEDKSRLGYTPSAALSRDTPICQRCFRLKNYNETQDVALTDKDYLEILEKISKKRGLIVKVVDIFDFNGSWLNGIRDFVGHNELMLIGNKVDLLPKSVNRKRLHTWMKLQAEERGIRPISIHVISAEKGDGILEVASTIEAKRNGQNVYVIGCTNVGKSTFINKLITSLGDSGDPLLTTSRFPGTTLDVIEIPLDENHALYDTPGIINDHQFVHYVDRDELRMITPKKEIKPKTFQLNERQTLFIGGLARFDFLKGERTSFTCYFANELTIHRTKLENADDLYERQKGKMLIPPKLENSNTYPSLTAHHFHIRGTKTDIVFSGLGWVTVTTDAEVVAHSPEGIALSARSSLI